MSGQAIFEGIELAGGINTDHTVILNNVRSAIRRQHPQVWPTGVNGDRVALVAGGSSLNDTLDELRTAIFQGAKLVTVNGAYQWCIDRNLQPRAQIVLDARQSNARFLTTAVENCRYYICSQCAPETWDAVADRKFVGIWHDAATEEVKAELDDFYLGQWHGIAGGTTVGTRAIGLMRTLGYLRFDCFGLDSCWIGDQHHAYNQPENAGDKRLAVTVTPKEHPERARTFMCAPWMLKQAEDFVGFVRVSGEKFLLNVHGDGLIAYLLTSVGDDVELQSTEITDRRPVPFTKEN